MKNLALFIFLSLLVTTNSQAGLFDKKEFKFERCYTESYSNHNDWIENGLFLKWEWEINLKNKTATRIAQSKLDDKKLNVDQFQIIAVTKEFIKTNSLLDTSYIFFRKNGTIQISGWGDKSTMKCEVFD
jgi:hypothetical protein